MSQKSVTSHYQMIFTNIHDDSYWDQKTIILAIMCHCNRCHRKRVGTNKLFQKTAQVLTISPQAKDFHSPLSPQLTLKNNFYCSLEYLFVAGEHCDHETRLWAQEHFGVSKKEISSKCGRKSKLNKFRPIECGI